MESFRQQAIAILIPQHYDEHTIEDMDRPYYRECHVCGKAFRKDETVRMDYAGRFYCNEQCILKRAENLMEVAR